MRVYDLGADIMSVGKPLKVAESPGFTEGVMLNNRRMVDGHFLSYISYSTGRWNTEHYNVRYATATSPLGTWTYRGVIMRKGRLQRPGHHSFVDNPAAGGWIAFYHRWEQQTGRRTVGERKVAVAPVRINADGTLGPIEMEPIVP